MPNHNQHTIAHLGKILAAFWLLALLLLACTPGLPDPQAAPTTPTPTATSVAVWHANYEPHRTVQYCPDDTGSYPGAFFHQANRQVADWLDQTVQINQDGLDLYTSPITSDTYGEPELTISVPAISPDPAMPDPLPAPTPSGNYIKDQQAHDAWQRDETKRAQEWMQAVQQHHDQVRQIQQQVHQKTNALRGLTLPIDHQATDIYGCLDRASDHFRNQGGVHLVILATDLEGNTSTEQASINLSGALVIVIWQFCHDAPRCAQVTREWRAYVKSKGAVNLVAYDASESPLIPNPLLP